MSENEQDQVIETWILSEISIDSSLDVCWGREAMGVL